MLKTSTRDARRTEGRPKDPSAGFTAGPNAGPNAGFAAGFTLIELMIVVVVVAILTSVALPAYQGHVIGTKRSSARAELLKTLARQEQYFINHKRYAASLDLLGYASSPYAIRSGGEIVPIDSPDRIYLLSIVDVSPMEAPSEFRLQAIPQLGQVRDSRCGVLGISSRGVKSASSGSIASCW